MKHDRRQGRTRTLGVLLLGALSLGMIGRLLLSGEGEQVRAAEAGPVGPAASPAHDPARLDPLAAGSVTPEGRVAAPVRTEPTAEAPASRKPKEVPLGTENAAIVEVRLVDTEGQPFRRAGVRVQVQSWLEDSSETFRHEVVTDADGIGRLAFEGMVHVDWFKHEPTWGAGLPFLYSEHHIDVDPGERWSEVLRVREGGRVVGRVVDTRGKPVAGAELHLFQEYYMGELADVWRPGIAHAVTDRAGAFEFPSLAAIGWSIAVPPFEWLQIEPNLVEGEDEVSYFELGPGETKDLGTFVVAPLARLDVQVVDLAGLPVEGAYAWLEPLRLDVPHMALRLEEEEDFDVWLRGEDPFREAPKTEYAWAFEPSTASTGADGRLVLLATPGEWDLRVRSGRDVGQEPLFDEQARVTLPCEPLTLSVPARFTHLAGRVLDHDDDVLAGARVVVSATERGGGAGLTAATDHDGVFRIPEVPLGKPLWVHVQGRDVLPASHPAVLDGPAVDADPADLPIYRARPASTLRVKLHYEGENRHGHGLFFRVRPERFESLTPPATPAERRLEEALRENPINPAKRGRVRDSITLPGLLPGAYRVEALVAVGTGEFQRGNGAPVVEHRVWESGVFETDTGHQLFTIDLTDYSPPQQMPGVTWSAQLRDAVSGGPGPQAWIEVEGDDWMRSTWSNRSGGFGFHIPDEPFELRVGAPGYHYEVRRMAAPGSLGEGMRIDLEPCGTRLAVHVVSREGQPLPSTRLRFRRPDGEEARARINGNRAWTSEGWTFGDEPMIVHDLPAGRWSVEVRLENAALGEYTLEVAASKELQQHTVTLESDAEAIRRAVQEAR